MIPLPILKGTLENLSRTADRVAEIQHFPCQDGCSWCCHTAPSVSPEEAQLVIEAIRGLKSSDQVEVHDRIDTWFDRTGLDPGTNRYRAAQSLGLIGLDRLAHQLRRAPCPLLTRADGTGRCRVYAARPSECRLHYAMGPDACQEPGKVRVMDVRRARTRMAEGLGLVQTDLLPVALRAGMKIGVT